jgi:hypothetical protein
MKEPIILDVNIGYFYNKNEILSALFVKRLLEYQTMSYIFDTKYKLKILDWYLLPIEFGYNEYILLESSKYTIKNKNIK